MSISRWTVVNHKPQSLLSFFERKISACVQISSIPTHTQLESAKPEGAFSSTLDIRATAKNSKEAEDMRAQWPNDDRAWRGCPNTTSWVSGANLFCPLPSQLCHVKDTTELSECQLCWQLWLAPQETKQTIHKNLFKPRQFKSRCGLCWPEMDGSADLQHSNVGKSQSLARCWPKGGVFFVHL